MKTKPRRTKKPVSRATKTCAENHDLANGREARP